MILTLIGIVSTVFNKAIMDEVLPYGLKNLLVSLIVVFSVVNLTSTLLFDRETVDPDLPFH